MERELISVIVPVYRVEKYLKECLDSILAQTYHNLEIILVDDGSPDKCGEICERYAEIDERIFVIHQKNAGLSVARNEGLSASHGEYIMFVDSDDWIEDTVIEDLFMLCKKSRHRLQYVDFYIMMETGKKELGKNNKLFMIQIRH